MLVGRSRGGRERLGAFRRGLDRLVAAEHAIERHEIRCLDQLQAQQALTASAKDNFVIADARYRGGIDTFLNSLDAQRSYYSAQQSLVSTQLTEATNLVTLYRVLGGDQSIETTPKGPKPLSPTAGPANQH